MKTFLSIGSGPGIGVSTAERFARGGFQVILTSRSGEKVEGLAEELKAKGYTAQGRTVDASDPASIASLIAGVEADHGAIDVIHYNAASLRLAGLDDQPADAINSDLAINVGGALATVQAIAPRMAERGAGTILITGGSFALNPNPALLTLSLGKAALRAMTIAIAPELLEKGIHLALLTVGGYVQPNTAIEIGEEFWKLYNQPKDAWTNEAGYTA